jgi:hypothetical protein
MRRVLEGESIPYGAYLASTERQVQLELNRIREGADKMF